MISWSKYYFLNLLRYGALLALRWRKQIAQRRMQPIDAAHVRVGRIVLYFSTYLRCLDFESL